MARLTPRETHRRKRRTRAEKLKLRSDRIARGDPTKSGAQPIKVTKAEQKQLVKTGFVPVVSSWVKAISKNKNNDLFVMFHDNTVFLWRKKGRLFNNMLRSPSKGRFVWRWLHGTHTRRVR